MPTNNHRDFAIGVFDSGLGGLTVVKEIIRQLPHEHIVYFGDTARVPYGIKSKESIIRFSIENTDVLLKYNVKMIIVACNSCSSYAMETLNKKFSLPIIGVIRPGAKKAVHLTGNRRIGIIATQATIKSGQYEINIKKFDRSAKVFARSCPLFVPLVEEGWLDKSVTYQVAEEYLGQLKKDRIDTLILGCTHYPLLKKVLHRVMGPKVKLVDSANEVALVAKNALIDLGVHRDKGKAIYKFLVSDKPQEFERIAKKFLGFELKNVKKV